MRLTKGHVGLALSCALIALVSAWLVLSKPEAGKKGGRPPYVLPVTLGSVVTRDVAPTVRLTGTVRSSRSVALAFTVSGLVVQVKVDTGDAPSQGAVLATLDAGDQTLALAERKAELGQAQRALEELLAGARPEELARLRADLQVAEAEEALAQIEVTRGEGLLTQNVISKAGLDRLEATLKGTAGKVGSAKARLAEAEAGAREEAKAVARAAVARAQASVATAERELAKTKLRAPWNARVQRRLVSAGAVVAAGSPIVELVDLAHLEALLQVPSRYAQQLGSAPKVRLTCDEAPEFHADLTVTAQAPAADERSRNLTIVVRISPATRAADGRPVTDVLKPGMFVRATLQLAPLRGALVVDPDAVRMTEKGPVLVVARASTKDGQAALSAEWVPVRLLGRDAEGQAVQSLGPPLQAGDSIVVSGVDLAFPGVPLMPRPDPAQRTTAAKTQATK